MDNQCELCGGALGAEFTCVVCGHNHNHLLTGTAVYDGLELIGPYVIDLETSEPFLCAKVNELIEKVNRIGEILNAQIRSK